MVTRASPTPPVVLTLAGTDSGGGAGVGADLATYAALGVHGTCVVTAVTAQDTTGVHAIHPVPIEMVSAQLDAVLTDLTPAVVKTGMLGTAGVAELVARRCAGLPLVVDPVLRATTGAALAGPELVEAYRSSLLPVATVVTPNAAEARALLGVPDGTGMTDADLAVALADLLAGPAVVLTGGPVRDSPPAHDSTPSGCTDWLARPGRRPVALEHATVATTNDHGTGCTHASALAAFLSRGDELATAAARAAAYVTDQLAASQAWQLGRGRGPLAHTHATHPIHVHPTNHSVPLTEETA